MRWRREINPESSRVEVKSKVSEKSLVLADGMIAGRITVRICIRRRMRKTQLPFHFFFCKIPRERKSKESKKIVTISTEKVIFSDSRK